MCHTIDIIFKFTTNVSRYYLSTENAILHNSTLRIGREKQYRTLSLYL
jgi:hypothetical protein